MTCSQTCKVKVKEESYKNMSEKGCRILDPTSHIPNLKFEVRSPSQTVPYRMGSEFLVFQNSPKFPELKIPELEFWENRPKFPELEFRKFKFWEFLKKENPELMR